MTRTFRRLLAFTLLLTVLTASPARAQLHNAGDPCPEPTAGRIFTQEGSAGPSLVCNGTTLEVDESISTGPYARGIGTAAPKAPLHVAGEVIVGPTTGLACDANREGALRWKTTAPKCIEICDGSSWACVGTTSSADCSLSPVGTVCADGTVYAGTSPASGTPMYVTRCDGGRTWDGSACIGSHLFLPWNNGNITGYLGSSSVDCTVVPCAGQNGRVNTAILAAMDSDSGTTGIQPYQAAAYCDSLNIHGHTDWYLPSLHELHVILDANNPDMAIGTGDDNTLGDFAMNKYYWSSSGRGGSWAWYEYVNAVIQNNTLQSEVYAVRCVRR